MSRGPAVGATATTVLPMTSVGDGSAAAASSAAATAAAASTAAAPVPVSRWSEWNASLPAPLSRVTVSYFLAGAMARVSSAAITSPLDCIKVRAQFSQATPGVVQYAGALDAARHMWRLEGVPAFYRGLPMRIAYVAPAAAVSFILYEQFRVAYHSSGRSSTHGAPWVAFPLVLAGLARVLGTTLRTPFDLVRQRMQIQGSLAGRAEQVKQPLATRQHGIYRHSGEALWRVGKVEGVATLWAGLGATILRDIPFAVIYFFAYESSKTLQMQYLPHTVLPPPPPSVAGGPVNGHSASSLERSSGLTAPRYMLSGAFAAACAVVLTMPLDVVKTRLQTQGSLATRRYSGIIDCVRKIAHEEGLRGFYKGCAPRVLYLAPAAAITFSLYEIYKRRLQRWMDIDEC